MISILSSAHGSNRRVWRRFPLVVFLLTGASGLCSAAETSTGRAGARSQPEAAAFFVLEWGSRGAKPGEFNFPIGIAVGPNDEVFVTDFYNDRVQKFSATGKLLSCFAV